MLCISACMCGMCSQSQTSSSHTVLGKRGGADHHVVVLVRGRLVSMMAVKSLNVRVC